MSLFMVVVSANAQIKNEIQKSKERNEKLVMLLNGYKVSGNASVDEYGEAVKVAAVFAIENSEKLENMYQRTIGETKDGVTDMTITKPTLLEWEELAKSVVGETISLKVATDKATEAGKEFKQLSEDAAAIKNPMKAAKSVKTAKAAGAVVEFGNAATPILLEESVAQANAVKEIIQTLKSGKNL